MMITAKQIDANSKAISVISKVPENTPIFCILSITHAKMLQTKNVHMRFFRLCRMVICTAKVNE